MPVYRDYDQAALDDQYTQTVWVPDITPFTAITDAMSADARASLEMHADLAYGASAAERLDIFPPPSPGAPVRVFFHGGSWLRNTKENAAYAAKMHVEAGAGFVAVNFAKADEVSLDEIIRQSRAAVAWVYKNIADFNCDPERIYIGGHSSGAHQGGVVLITDWSEFEIPADAIKGAVLVSGMYDLEPVRLSARNDYLHLDEAAARRNSAIHHIPARGVPLVIGHAEFDSEEFRRQSKAFAEAWETAGHSLTTLPIAGENHFSIAPGLGRPDSALGRASLEQMGL